MYEYGGVHAQDKHGCMQVGADADVDVLPDTGIPLEASDITLVSGQARQGHGHGKGKG